MIWKCKNREIEYGKKTLIMGIINVTPDSFSDGGINFCAEKAAEAALKMQENGADIIDFGGQSTRPGFTPVSAEEEWERLKPVLSSIKGRISIPISIDTFYAQVASEALKNGAEIINDVSGAVSPDMAHIIKREGAGWIIMHSGAGIFSEIVNFWQNAEKKAVSLGVSRNQLCFDMGIGFGKTREQDMSLIANVCKYKPQGFPLLLGASRKRVIGIGSRQENPGERIFGNIAADTAAILGGADIIRLHDVEREKQGIYMADCIKNAAIRF